MRRTYSRNKDTTTPLILLLINAERLQTPLVSMFHRIINWSSTALPCSSSETLTSKTARTQSWKLVSHVAFMKPMRRKAACRRRSYVFNLRLTVRSGQVMVQRFWRWQKWVLIDMQLTNWPTETMSWSEIHETSGDQWGTIRQLKTIQASDGVNWNQRKLLKSENKNGDKIINNIKTICKYWYLILLRFSSQIMGDLF